MTNETAYAYRVTRGAHTLGIISLRTCAPSTFALRMASVRQLGADENGYRDCTFRIVFMNEVAATVGAFLRRHNGKYRVWRDHADVILAESRKGIQQ